MKTPRDVHADALADHLVRCWDYRKTHWTGSHIHLRTDQPSGQTTIVPAHKPLKTGALNSIPYHVARHKGIGRSDIVRSL